MVVRYDLAQYVLMNTFSPSFSKHTNEGIFVRMDSSVKQCVKNGNGYASIIIGECAGSSVVILLYYLVVP